MRSALLQKLLDKQKQTKYGDFVTGEQWSDLHSNLITGKSKLEDILPPLIDSGKLVAFTEYVASIEPVPFNIKILTQLISRIPENQLSVLSPYFRNLVLGYTQYQSQIIDLLVRSFFLADSQDSQTATTNNNNNIANMPIQVQTHSNVFVDTILSILQAIPSIHSTISASITKFSPQTNFPPDQQIRFLRHTLHLCTISVDIAVASLGRIFQHLVALDCELLLDSGNSDRSVQQVDDDVAQCLIPQLSLFLRFVSQTNNNLFTLLLQLFDLYMVDLPRVVAVQFIFFFSASFDHPTAETFVGFLLAKIIDDSASLRTRTNATLYLESLVVHALYIDDEFAAAVVDYVANFANCYSAHIRNEAPERLKMDVKLHHLYYFAVQCVTYITCWRYYAWTNININPVQRWNLGELLTSPMRAIDVIDRNTAEMIKSLKLFPTGNDSVVIERIHVWFPFDPCPLEEIAAFIAPSYIQWSDVECANDVDALLDSELSRLCASRLMSVDPVMQSPKAK